MEAKSVLKEFRQRRKLLENLRENAANTRLKAMWDFLDTKPETNGIMMNVPSVEHILNKAQPTTQMEAGTPDEIIGIGLYIMKQCSETNKHITSLISNLGIGSKGQKPTRQSYVDDAMVGYIKPALDFIEEKLEELVTTESKQKSTESDSSKITAAQTDEKQAKKFSEGPYGDKGGQEGEGQKTDGEDKDWLEQEIVKQEERDKLKFALETKSIMKVAMQLEAMKGNDKWELHTREILVAIAYSGQREESDYKTAQFVLEKLRRNKSDYLEDYFKRIDSETSIDKIIKGKVLKRTGYVGDALRWAKKCALSTTDKNLIRIRHLLAALLFFRAAGKAKISAQSLIEEAGIGLTTFIREFQQYVKIKFKEDKTEAWRKIFGEIQKVTEEIEISKYGKGHIATYRWIG